MTTLPAGSGGFINPAAVITQLPIKEGMKVASLGCGHGYFTIPLAKMVGNTGKVYAVDIREDALASVRSRAETENLKNIESVRANLEKENGTGLPNAECDFAILANILFQSQKKQEIIKEAARILKSQGRLVIVDWKTEDLSIGPKEGWRIQPQVLIEMARQEGVLFLKEFNTGNFHYGLIFVK